MAKVFLRVYSREIEGMIEVGQLEEAIAHCQHVLKTFPMHVETYRLLGKSFLEARRYTDAADIFQRVLMTMPDDFVAHVGMSIIRDDEGNLDDAIWHMERAFEGQPSNPAIQGELRRLYGRRDGVEPSKIRLSRDALANMYAQGELFNQAIAEIRAVLAEDANRPDLQVMLARAYYRSGQKVEAAEMAANLLKKYTYCLDALRILVDVLPGSLRAENTQVYRQRLRMLDPYSSFVTDSTFNTDQVPDTAVNLERLDYTAGASLGLPRPNWASSLGIKLADERRTEPAPDWMKISKSEEPLPTPAPDSSGPEMDDKSLPNWMHSADWKETSGNTQEEPMENGPKEPAELNAQADIPDWLKAMAPQEITDSDASSGPTPDNLPSMDAGEPPDWFMGKTPQETSMSNAGSEPVSVNVSPTGEEEGLDWLAEPEPTAAEANPALSQPAVFPEGGNDFPDWLKEISNDNSAGDLAALAVDGSEGPKGEETPASTEPAPFEFTTQPPIEPQVFDLPTVDETPIQTTGGSKPLEIEEDALAWLEGLAAKQGVKEEELLTKPEERSDEMPEWLRSPEEPPATPAKPEPLPEPKESMGSEPIAPLAGEASAHESVPTKEFTTPMHPAEESAQPPGDKDDKLEWLDGITSKADVQEGELTTEPEDHLEGMPDWLRSPYEPPVSPFSPAPAPEPSETKPLEPISALAGETAADGAVPIEEIAAPMPPAEGSSQAAKIEDETLAWLEELASKQVEKEELSTVPANRFDEMPDWLRLPDEPRIPPAETKATPTAIDSMPLESIQPLAGKVATSEPAPAKEFTTNNEDLNDGKPDWLRSPTRQTASSATPETPAVPNEAQPFEEPSPPSGEFGTLESFSTEELSQPILPVEEADLFFGEKVPETLPEGLGSKQEIKPEEPPINRLMRSDTQPEWIQEPEQEIPTPVEAQVPATTEEESSISSWLSKMEIQEALSKAQPTPGEEHPAAISANDLPDWLMDMDTPTAQAETPKPSEDLPDWLRQAVLPTDQGSLAAPIPEHAMEPEMPAWIDEEIPVSDLSTPTTPGEWLPVDEKPARGPDIKSNVDPVKVTYATPLLPRYPKPTGILSHIPGHEKDADLLGEAQSLLDGKKLNEAMQVYSTLIKKKRLLEEVIHDLREAIYRFPVDIIVWQTLGDASIRANHLQDALDAYTKAEELLR